LMIEIETLGESIARASDLEVEYFDYLQSALFKSKFFNGPRVANPRPIV